MNKIHLFFQKTLIATVALVFAFVMTYVPQNYNDVKAVEAAGMGDFSTTSQQLVQIGQVGTLNGTALATKAASVATQAYTYYLQYKESVLDGIAWTLVKAILSQMTASIVNWINSGFQGSPAFVQDLQGFLVDIADETFGQYLEDLGGPFSFLCSPFRLDVLIAIETSYRERRDSVGTRTCRVTDMMQNFDAFRNGDFINGGGWDAWITMTSEPDIYTEYGAFLRADIEAQIRESKAQNNARAELSFGSGFLSNKMCEAVEGASSMGRNCVITTPGRVISEALTFQLSTGPSSLIEADEINEIVSALFAQLANQAITGAAGLLGLSSGTGYTNSGYTTGSYLGDMNQQNTPNMSTLLQDLRNSLRTESRYQAAALQYYPLLQSGAGLPPERRPSATNAANAIAALLPTLNSNITALNNLIRRVESLEIDTTSTSSASTNELQNIMTEYSRLRLHSDNQVDSAIQGWREILQMYSQRPPSQEQQNREDQIDEIINNWDSSSSYDGGG